MTPAASVDPKPPAVRLQFVGVVHMPGDEKPIMVEAYDTRTGDTVGLRPLPTMAEWLRVNGYEYQTGSRAVWKRQ